MELPPSDLSPWDAYLQLPLLFRRQVPCLCGCSKDCGSMGRTWTPTFQTGLTNYTWKTRGWSESEGERETEKECVQGVVCQGSQTLSYSDMQTGDDLFILKLIVFSPRELRSFADCQERYTCCSLSAWSVRSNRQAGNHSLHTELPAQCECPGHTRHQRENDRGQLTKQPQADTPTP